MVAQVAAGAAPALSDGPGLFSQRSGTALADPPWRSRRGSAGPGLRAPPTRSMGKARVAQLGLLGSVMGTVGLAAKEASLT